jgi:predicted amidophosphoribosyltransferase
MFVFGPLWFVVTVMVIYYFLRKKPQKPVVQYVYNCSKCSAVVNYGSQFCSSCGLPVVFARYCSSCGSQISERARFCAQCGTTLTQQSALEQAPIEASKKSAELIAAQVEFDKTKTKLALIVCAVAGVILLGLFILYS